MSVTTKFGNRSASPLCNAAIYCADRYHISNSNSSVNAKNQQLLLLTHHLIHLANITTTTTTLLNINTTTTSTTITTTTIGQQQQQQYPWARSGNTELNFIDFSPPRRGVCRLLKYLEQSERC